MANNLSMEKSPYLLQHKDNPVNWYPWCREAFNKAEAEDKPVFLSIGYSTCHWCHVMAHESFEDKKIAELLDDFVCIKVDREERPDIDAIYMTVCQALTGSGGWPLTIIMTPEQKPFFAATYLPKTDRYGRTGLTGLLKQVSMIWKTEKDKLVESGNNITSILQHSEHSDGKAPDKNLLIQGFEALQNSFDPVWGGFGTAPKFPSPHNLLFLMRIYETENKQEALRMAEITLNGMAAGGIFDHIGGGFSRYSTDEKWLVPHFEKMLYDNALLLTAYLEAFQLTKNNNYADIAGRTADYILRELTDKDGGFYCGQDADSDGIEGLYYTFSTKEITDVLGEEDGREFCNMYNITEAGNFEGKNIPNRTGKKGSAWRADDSRLLKLLEYRKKKTRLNLDNKILLSWNAWTIIALAKAGNILNNSRYLNAAINAQEFIAGHMTDKNNRLYLRYCSGEAACFGQLEDYAVYALALIELYGITFNVKYLKEALIRAKQMLELFEDKTDGGFYMTAHDAEKLITRIKETWDGAIPSGNSVAAMVLGKLGKFTGDIFWSEAAERQHRFMAGQISVQPTAHCFGLTAMSEAIYPHRELLITGNRLPKEIIEYIRDNTTHDISIIYKSSENEKELSTLVPFTKSYPLSEHTVWYMCKNGVCQKPETEWKNVEKKAKPPL